MRPLLILATLALATSCPRSGQGAMDKLHPCGISEGPPDAYCGHYSVFEDRIARTGRSIDLKIVVAPALRRDPRPDPIFIFEGGPGGGAATLAQYHIPTFRRYQLDRDIVMIDQRGTGESNPLDCVPSDPDKEDLSQIDAYPVEEFRTCLSKIKADPRLYTTTIAVDDIDDVRQWLGYEAINLWGGSYGSRAALVYLKRHEASVRTVVLDGVAPPDMRLPLYIARDGQRALDRLIDDCEKNGACSHAFPGLRERFASLWTTLASKPRIQFAHPRTGKSTSLALSQRFVAMIVLHALYSPELAALLPKLLTDASNGNYQGLLALAYPPEMPKGAMSEGMFLSVTCAEDMPRISVVDVVNESEGRFLGSAMFDTRMKPCEFWPRGTVTEDYYAPINSSKPVLLFSGADDPVTPPSWGEEVAKSLPNSRHVIVPGAGHITLNRGCVTLLVGKFLDAARVVDLDTSCVNSLKRPPFFTSYTGAEPQP